MKLVRRGNLAVLQRTLDTTVAASPTFPGDPDAPTPKGYRAEEYRRRLGTGDETFVTAVEAVMTWQVQRESGLVAHAESDRVATGMNVVVGLPAGPLLILAPCRVDRVYDSPTKSGFRYVTMPGHPERGHEEFVVERDTSGEVYFVARPVSRPGSVLTWIGAPVAKVIQRIATTRYLDTMVDVVNG